MAPCHHFQVKKNKIWQLNMYSTRRHIRLSNFILFHLKMMTLSHQNVVHNSFRLFLSLNFPLWHVNSYFYLSLSATGVEQDLPR